MKSSYQLTELNVPFEFYLLLRKHYCFQGVFSGINPTHTMALTLYETRLLYSTPATPFSFPFIYPPCIPSCESILAQNNIKQSGFAIYSQFK